MSGSLGLCQLYIRYTNGLWLTQEEKLPCNSFQRSSWHEDYLKRKYAYFMFSTWHVILIGFFFCCSFSHGFYYVHIAVLTDGTYRTLSDCKHCSSSMTQHRSNASILAKEAREKKNWNILFWCMEWNWKGLVKDKRQKRKWLSSLTNITTDIKLEDFYGDIAMMNLYCKTENSDFFFCIIFSGHQDWAQC